MYSKIRRRYFYTRLKLFHTDKSLAARRSFHLKMLTFLLFVTVIWMFLKSGNIAWLWFQDQSQHHHADKRQQDLHNSEDTALCRRPHQKSSVTPFLSTKTKLSENVFKWWKHLQKERGNFSYYEEMVKKLFEIFPPIPHLGKPPLHKCSTCAVVGNSFNLKGSNYGTLIDSKDIIIRMNSAPTKGYEEDVGTKTTHRVMYPESAVDLDNSTHLVLVPFKILDIEWLIGAFTTGFHGKSYAPIKPRIHANKDLVIVISPAFMKHVHQMWLNEKGRYPSTGFMTVVLSLHICDEINVFGYGADRFGKWSHYFETLKDKNFKTGQHPGRQEYKILQKLNFEKVVKLYRGA
ncbi:CMP-N-acetylneuraminate-beta-galactosamide-alpha-2,3-sialyltransferase 1-like [Gambusia affinis]|uniref:CMP-N-acetylneuraminate-beta-galactosamide- alpha-2,3-sialyltransferase 1-like n=1 Tax=Gambusia affinis TaxID=33528 RepID=UPI001CDCF05C|nr:CMP-N-acetylneuraminate-beta-galactosamide-alpha-2,3-sialyltransferase 1-like [Gambusia affinis]XP_043994135.1 CMP-N-acetylneuraminate-beta-galactosamide-alpha-2,3-sialyltransferase 1-like [Gambusia affinis]XP_043994136.1 CMP-N-acetylneuraminate-beta-galactosamide-alpha-2,3-sialyltransferase 1-like [Gambusia affinis]